MSWGYFLAALNGILALFAWVSKLRWSKEYREAKDSQIASLHSHIETLKTEIEHLRELSPMKVQEYLKSTTQMLTEYNDQLQAELDRVRGEIEQKEEQVKQLKLEGTEGSLQRNRLASENKELQEKAIAFETELRKIQAELFGASALDELGGLRNWENFLAYIRDRKITLGIWLMAADPSRLVDNKLLLGFSLKNRFAYEMVNESKNRLFVENLARDFFGKPISIIPKLMGKSESPEQSCEKESPF